MKQAVNIVWAEGELLTQQHLQQFQYYYMSQLQKQVCNTLPFKYGFMVLDIDENSIVNQQFILNAAEGYFANGRYFNISKPLTLSHCEEGPIYLCLNDDESISGLVGYKHRQQQSTYLAEKQQFCDYYDPSRLADLYIKHENYYLSQQPHQQHQQIIIAKLCKGDKAFLQLNAEIIPPCLNIFACVTFKKIIAKDIAFLQSEKKQYDASLQHHFCYLAINQFLAKLQCAQQLNFYHPWQYYQDSQVFLAAINAQGELRYNHERFFENILYFRETYQRLLNHYRPHKQQILQLVRESPTLFISENLNAFFHKKQTLYLWISLLPHDPRVQALSQNIKVVPLSELNHRMQAALPGVELLWRYLNPLDEVNQGSYFELNSKDDLYQKIVLEKQLAIFLTQSLLDVEIKLIARGNTNDDA